MARKIHRFLSQPFHVPETFYMVGGIEEAAEKAKTIT